MTGPNANPGRAALSQEGMLPIFDIRVSYVNDFEIYGLQGKQSAKSTWCKAAAVAFKKLQTCCFVCSVLLCASHFKHGLGTGAHC